MLLFVMKVFTVCAIKRLCQWRWVWKSITLNELRVRLNFAEVEKIKISKLADQRHQTMMAIRLYDGCKLPKLSSMQKAVLSHTSDNSATMFFCFDVTIYLIPYCPLGSTEQSHAFVISLRYSWTSVNLNSATKAFDNTRTLKIIQVYPLITFLLIFWRHDQHAQSRN